MFILNWWRTDPTEAINKLKTAIRVRDFRSNTARRLSTHRADKLVKLITAREALVNGDRQGKSYQTLQEELRRDKTYMMLAAELRDLRRADGTAATASRVLHQVYNEAISTVNGIDTIASAKELSEICLDITPPSTDALKINALIEHQRERTELMLETLHRAEPEVSDHDDNDDDQSIGGTLQRQYEQRVDHESIMFQRQAPNPPVRRGAFA